MSDFGIFSSRLQINNKSLKELEDALRYLRNRSRKHTEEDDTEYIQKIKSVFEPIIDNINGNLSKSILIDEQNVVELLHRRKLKNWQAYKEMLIKLFYKISKGDLELNPQEISILNDVADAMEIECSKLFKRLGRFP